MEMERWGRGVLGYSPAAPTASHTSKCKTNGHYSIENHRFQGQILHSFCIFNRKFENKQVGIYIAIGSTPTSPGPHLPGATTARHLPTAQQPQRHRLLGDLPPRRAPAAARRRSRSGRSCFIIKFIFLNQQSSAGKSGFFH